MPPPLTADVNYYSPGAALNYTLLESVAVDPSSLHQPTDANNNNNNNNNNSVFQFYLPSPQKRK